MKRNKSEIYNPPHEITKYLQKIGTNLTRKKATANPPTEKQKPPSLETNSLKTKQEKNQSSKCPQEQKQNPRNYNDCPICAH